MSLFSLPDRESGRKRLVRIAIAFVTSFVIVFSLESVALAVIGWVR
jgi:hypothetical protein